ncbi:MAG: type II secretion system protein GspL [Nevskiaceae bacterium]
MRDTLYLQLRDVAPDEHLAYATASAGPGSGIRAQHGTLEAILPLAADRRVVLFVPAADVRLAAVQVPAQGHQRILQAAPYAIEDQLAEDVDTLHFAIGVPGGAGNGAHPVAVVARSRMDAWLAPLRARGVRVDAAVPESLCLPAPEAGRWTGLADGGCITVRTGPWSGFSCTLEDLGATLQIADPDARAALRVFATREVEFDFSRAGRPVELLPGYASALEVLARHWQPSASIDLLQGAYSERKDWQRAAQPWRLAATLGAIWLVVVAVVQAAGTWRSGRELAAQSQSNFERCRQLFPNDCVSETLMPAVIEQQARLRGTGRQPALLPLLGTLGAALQANPGLTLDSLEFRDGVLHLSLKGADLQALEALRAWYGTRRDAQLQVEAANAGTSGVQIRVKLTPA